MHTNKQSINIYNKIEIKVNNTLEAFSVKFINKISPNLPPTNLYGTIYIYI